MNPKSNILLAVVAILLILCTFVTVSCGGCTSSRLTRIAFITKNEAKSQDYMVVSIREDGSDLRELGPWLYSFRIDLHQCWSANGKRLIYTEGSRKDPVKWLAVVDADGSNRHQLLDITKMNIRGFCISPDGETLLLAYQELFEVIRDGETHLEPQVMPTILAIDIESGKVTPLTNFTDIEANSPVFSPNGKQIAFMGRTDDPETHFDLYVMKADGTDVRRMTHHHGVLPYLESGLQWSPDNRKVLYSLVTSFNDSTGYSDLLVMDITTGEEVNLTNTDNISENDPRWSPDGKLITFTLLSGKYQTPFTMVMDAGGTNLKTVAKWLCYVSWLPDSRRLIGMGHTEESVPAVITIDIDGVNTEILLPFSVIADNYSGMSYPVWLRNQP